MKKILFTALVCFLGCGCASLRYEIHEAIESRKILKVDYDEVWFVSHENLKANRIEHESSLRILNETLADTKSFGRGVCFCHFELYSLLFIKKGKLVLRLTPNLTGGSLGANPADDQYPSSWSTEGYGNMCLLFHIQLEEIKQGSFVADKQLPYEVAMFLKTLKDTSNKGMNGTR